MEHFAFSNLIIRSLTFAFILPLMAGCDDPVAPGADLVAGSYSATQFRVVTGTTDVDLLALGASLTLDIHDDGSFQGHLTVPENESVLEEIDTDISGWWTISDKRLRLNGYLETFINDASIPVRNGDFLYLSSSLGEAEVVIALTEENVVRLY